MAFGNTPVQNLGWRFSVHYGDLEFRMDHLTSDEENQVINIYLPSCQALENDILTQVRTNADTSQAAVWYRNPNELMERTALYNKARRMLCEFIGCAYGIGLGSGGYSRTI